MPSFPRTGLKLLEDTLGYPTDSSTALGRVLLALHTGTLSVNGQPPDKNYPLGEYLIHGGRIKFDLSELKASQQEQLFQLITLGKAAKRPYATHCKRGVDASGCPAEGKANLKVTIQDTVRLLLDSTLHYGINLAIGGRAVPNEEGEPSSHDQYPDESGEWGHMYLYKAHNLFLIGIESSAPGMMNKRTLFEHSWKAKSSQYSAFMEQKIGSHDLTDAQERAGKIPLTTEKKYNWATVKFTPHDLAFMQTTIRQLEQRNNELPYYTRLLYQAPRHAQRAEPNRFAKMAAWAQATEQGNKPERFIKLLGLFAVVVGLILVSNLIPVVTVALGGELAALGVGGALGLIGVNMLVREKDPTTANTLYQNTLAQLGLKSPAPGASGNSTEAILRLTNTAKAIPNPPPPTIQPLPLPEKKHTEPTTIQTPEPAEKTPGAGLH